MTSLRHPFSAAARGPAKRRLETGFPPWDLERLGAGKWRLTLAVAGYALGDLSIEQDRDRLSVRGARPAPETRRFHHQGIAERRFRRVFQLAPGVQAAQARLNLGLLEIELESAPDETDVKSTSSQSKEHA